MVSLHDMTEHVIEIARVCHEVNRAVCQASGDTSQKPWPLAESWQRESIVRGVNYVRANPGATPAAQHSFWMEGRIAAGWTFGLVKDPVAKTHPCLLPYDQMPFEQRVKDFLFRAVVKAMSGIE